MFFQLIILFQIMIKNTIYNLIKNIFFTFININQVNAHKNNWAGAFWLTGAIIWLQWLKWQTLWSPVMCDVKMGSQV